MYIAYPEYFLFPNFDMRQIDDDQNFYRQELEEENELGENLYQIIDDEYITETLEK
ncbi:hypothetical protein [Clostridium akagii]|uniref:hypothetical protein n=1 Tax=Clostridium akagii TaxID=91623 RepID=UPI000AF835EE|nr:hypothetical protein [Clostridium akagii]